MARRYFQRKWTAALLLALLLAGGRLVSGLLQAGPAVEVVNAWPIHAVHEVSALAIQAAPLDQAAPVVQAAPVEQAAAEIDLEGLPANTQGSAANPSASPRVELPVTSYDFGLLRAGAVVRRDFLVINRGTAPLVIHSAITTCGCTSADVSASIIPPGKAARATVIFDSSIHPLPGQTVRRGLILKTNDPERPLVEIWVQARLR